MTNTKPTPSIGFNPLTQLTRNSAQPAQPVPVQDANEYAAESQLLGIIRPDLNQDNFTPLDLAMMNTDDIEELRNRAESMLAREKKFVLKSPDELRVMLDLIDSRFQSDERLGAFELAPIRNYIQAVMTTLRHFPEFETIVLDADVRNIIRFAIETFTNSSQAVGSKALNEATKKSIRAPKAAAKAEQLAIAEAVLAKMLGNFGT